MKILLTGGTGTLGHILAETYADKVDQWISLSRDEYKIAVMSKQFVDYKNMRWFISDVRNYFRILDVFQHKKPDLVIHAAAMKHIDLCEYNPMEAIETNVNGTANIVKACIQTGVKRAVFIGSDKGVDPISVYGATKLMGERIFKSANVYGKTQFACVRYGNVIGSRGSLVGIVEQCKKEGKPVPVVDPDATRFWLPKENAARLVWYALTCTDTTDKTFVAQCPSYTVMEMIDSIWSDAPTVPLPMRGVEKKHELLAGDGEEVRLVNKDFNGSQLACGPISSRGLNVSYGI